jgi:hypothetical protein
MPRQAANNKVGDVHAFDLQTKFLMEAINEVQMTNRFLDTKAGVLVSIESTLLFVVVAMIFDTQKFETIKQAIQAMPPALAIFILLYCAIYISVLVIHIIYTIRVLSPHRNAAAFVQTGGYKPKGLFFLSRDKVTGIVQPSIREYVDQLTGSSEQDILSEFTYEFMKLSYIRDAKAHNIQVSQDILRYLIIGIMVFGMILLVTY